MHPADILRGSHDSLDWYKKPIAAGSRSHKSSYLPYKVYETLTRTITLSFLIAIITNLAGP